MASWQDTYEQLKKRKDALDQLENASRIKQVKKSSTPAKTTTKKKEEDNKWYEEIFSKGEFRDGYQIGDISKTILGTSADLTQDVMKGILSPVESLLDIGTNAVASGLGAVGLDKAEKTTRKFADANLSEMGATNFSNIFGAGLIYNAASGNFNNIIDYDFKKTPKENYQNIVSGNRVKENATYEDSSVLGKYADKTGELVGYGVGLATGTGLLSKATGTAAGGLTTKAGTTALGGSISGGNIGLTIAGKTLNIPTLALAGGMAGGLNEANQKEDVTEAERWTKGVSSGLIEGVTEGLFGMFGVGGNDLTDNIAKSAIDKMSSKAGKVLATIGIKGTGEATEEFLSYAANYLVDNNLIDKMGDADFSQDWDWGDVGEQMALAFVSAGIMQGGSVAINSSNINIDRLTNNTVEYIEAESGTKVTAKQKAEIRNQIENQLIIDGGINQEDILASQNIQVEDKTGQKVVNDASNTQIEEEIAPIQEQNTQENITQENVVNQEEALARLNQLEEIKQQAATEQQYNAIQEEINKVSKQVEQIQQKTAVKETQEVAPTKESNNNKTLLDDTKPSISKSSNGDKVYVWKFDESKPYNISVTQTKKGIIFNNAFLSDEVKGKGEGTKIALRLNEMSLEKTGKPLKSLPEYSKVGLKNHTEEGKGLWDSLVRKGYAIKNKDNSYTMLDTIAPKEATQEVVNNELTEELQTEAASNKRATFKSVMSDNGKPVLVDVEGNKTTIDGVEVGIYRNKETGQWHVVDLESGFDLTKGANERKTKKSAIENATKNIQENDLAPLRKTAAEKYGFKNVNKQEKTTPTQKELDNLEDIRQNKSGSEYADAFYNLEKKYGQAELYKSLNNYKTTGEALGDIAPIKAELDDLTSEIKSTIKDTTKELKAVKKELKAVKESIDETKALAEQQVNINSLTDNDIAPLREDTTPIIEEQATIESPLENRDIDEVGSRSVKAYQYENPEVRPYFRVEAEAMLNELKNTVKGERMPIYDEVGNMDYTGVTRETTDAIAYLKDNYNYSYAEIEKGLNAIIEDNGKENIAVAKRIEFLLDERLRDGYTSIDGLEIPPSQEYIDFLHEKQITEYNRELSQALTDQDIPVAPIETTPIVETTPEVAPTRERYEAIEPNREIFNKGVMKRVKEVEKDLGYSPKDPTKESSYEEGKMRKWVETSTESDIVNREILPDDLDQNKIFYQPKTNKSTLNKANAMLDTQGYEKAVEYFNNKIYDKRTSLEDIALGERLIQEAMKKGDTKTAGELIQNVAILGTELGQKVQALSIIQRMTPEGQLKMIQKTINRSKVRGDKSFNNVELTQDMIDTILKTYNKDGTFSQDELNKAVEDVKQKIANQMEATTMDKINAWRYLSMLGNPKTHIRNLISNVAMKGTTAVKNVMARTIEDIAPIQNKTKTWKKPSQDVVDFAKQSTEDMKEIISGDSKYNEETSIKNLRRTFKNNILEKTYNFNSNLLEKEDWWFSSPVYKNSLSEFLTANGIKTQEDIKNNPKIVEKGKLYATEQSQIATFRQYSWLSNKIREIENKNVATQIAVGSVLPFKKTPINIAKTGLAYSPLGFAKTLTYDIAQVKKGNMEASTLIDHISQNTVGTALVLVGYMLAQAGFLNGAGGDEEESKYDYQLGKQGYSLSIDGKSYSLSWLSPVAIPMFVGANAYEQLVEDKEWNGDVVIETLSQTLDPLNEMSFLSGLNSVLSSYDSGMQKFAGIFETMFQNYSTQFVPTASSQLASTTDDTKRSTKVGSDSGFKVFEETINKLKYKIPGLRNTLEPSTDIWGNEIKQSENILNRAYNSFIAPYSSKENIATDIDENIKEVFSATGDNGVIPNVPRNYVNFDNEKYTMSAKQHTDFKKTYGQTANELLEELFNNSSYQNAGVEEKSDMINDVYDYAGDIAKKQFLSEKGVTYTNATEDKEKVYKEGKIKNAIENDMTVYEYTLYDKDPDKYKFLKDNNISYEEYEQNKNEYNFAYENPKQYAVATAIADYDTYKTYNSNIWDLKADKDSNGKSISGSRKEKVISYVNSLDLDIPQKAMLIRQEYSTFNDYNNQIIDYVANLDVPYENKVAIIEGLDMKVSKDGSVYWD